MIVKIKVNANIKYKIHPITGSILAEDMIAELYQNEHITKKMENVIKSIDNMLYDNKSIEHAEYDMLTNEVILYIKNTEEVENE